MFRSINRPFTFYFNPPAPCGAGPCYGYAMEWFCYFNPPAPCGAGPSRHKGPEGPIRFQSTRPVRGGTANKKSNSTRINNFNPPAPCGAGLFLGTQIPKRLDFNPPAPCGAGRILYIAALHLLYFNPPAPCGAGLADCAVNARAVAISIHPPRAGRDLQN